MQKEGNGPHVSRPSPSQVVLSRALWGCRDHDPEASLYSSPSLAMLPPQLLHLAPLPLCLYTAPTANVPL